MSRTGVTIYVLSLINETMTLLHFKSFQGNGYGGILTMGRNYMSLELPSAKDIETYCREDKS